MSAAVREALFVHGAGGGGWEWNAWCAAFAAHGIACHAPDLQPSPAGLGATTFADYLAQVRAAINALPRPRVLVGASLGGLLAMACADAADALVLINPMPPLPWSAQLPQREWPGVVPWRRDARLVSTRRVLPDADDASALFAFRHWRDESGAVLRAAGEGIAIPMPACRVLCIASTRDDDVPPMLTASLADAWGASLLRVPSPSHVGPLLGREAATVAAQAAAWLSAS
ncbi:alpha/beta hydrolase [Lysobacter koreensis]|uniref:Alpha/beta hydrolase n=1 Tax=Lysobacter koreensis TaxID=266122 RepID=A0ABW2YM06_9GAMM